MFLHGLPPNLGASADILSFYSKETMFTLSILGPPDVLVKYFLNSALAANPLIPFPASTRIASAGDGRMRRFRGTTTEPGPASLALTFQSGRRRLNSQQKLEGEESMKNWRMVFCFLLFLALFGMGALLEAGVVWVSPADFHPADGWTGYLVSQDGNFVAGGDALYLDSPDFTHFLARVYLPNGVTIKKVTLYVSHESDWYDDALKFFLSRTNLNDGTGGTMVYINSTGLPNFTSRAALKATSISFKTINNNLYAYTAYLTFYDTCTTNCKFLGAKIEY
jgi:hypothetical protein